MARRFVIVTGISGAGKSSVLNILEDAGYFCVDNLPVSLIKTFIQIVENGNDEKYRYTALGIDIRSAASFSGVDEVIDEMRKEEVPFEILYLDANDEALIRRFKETRRTHPLAGKTGRIDDGISQERATIAFLKERADCVLDTSNMLMRDLTRTIRKMYAQDPDHQKIVITLLSFGFKFGIPSEADMVFDVRFLPNPYYVEELKALSGNDPPVSDFVLGFDVTKEFIDKAADLIRFLIPGYIDEGKNMLVLAIGCTGGRHRSVAITNELYRRLECLDNSEIFVEHRDLIRDLRVKGD